MMEVGWIAQPLLQAEMSTPRLLKNVANTLGGAVLGAALAAKIAGSADEFWAIAHDFVPPEGFEEQYRAQLEYVNEHGILSIQAPFMNREIECRRIIEDSLIGEGPSRE